MDATYTVIKKILFAAISLLMVACAKPDRTETVMPAKFETCGGAAIQDRYIVRFKNGSWKFIQNPDREKFKADFVAPNIDSVDFIEYDQKISIKTDMIASQGYGVDNWGIDAIQAPPAWQNNWRGQDVTVAVIDSGVDITHAQLKTQIAYNAGEAGALATNGIDDDKNGLVDDFAGYNFLDDNAQVTDRLGHGTHVAGIIAARHNDDQRMTGYVQGVAPSAKILPIKFIGEDGGTMSAALRSIDYAVSQGAQIINASWGGTGCSLSLRQKVAEVAQKNVLFVVAAGNSGSNLELSPEYPAAFNLPAQITVGALGESLLMANYSNYSNSLVHLFAPGSQIVSTVPGQGYAAFSGTSMATPFVAGAAAVLLSANHTQTPADLRRHLFATVETENNYSNLTRGRLNLASAVNALGQ